MIKGRFLAGIFGWDPIGDAIKAVTDWIVNAFKTVFFWIARGLFTILDAFMDIIFKLAGFSNLDSGGNILSMFFSNTSDGAGEQISTLYMYLCLLCAGLMLFFAVIQIIRQDFFTEAGPQSHGPIFKKMFIGLLWFIAIPPVFIFAVDLVSGLIAAIMRIKTFSQIGSMSQAIFEMCLETPQWVRNANARGDAIKLDPIPHWSAMTTRDFISLTNVYDFNYFVFFAVLVMSFYSLFMLAFGLVKRIISLVFLYVMGPIAISQSILDNGNKMKDWQKKVVAQFTSVFGTIISLVILFMFITQVVEDLNFFDAGAVTGIWHAGAVLANTVIKALFIFVAFDMVKNGEYIKDFLSTLTVSESANVANVAAGYAATTVKVAKLPIQATQGVVKAVSTVGGTAVGLGSILTGHGGNEYTDKLKVHSFDGFRNDIQKAKHEEKVKAAAKDRETRFNYGLVGKQGIRSGISAGDDPKSVDYKNKVNTFHAAMGDASVSAMTAGNKNNFRQTVADEMNIQVQMSGKEASEVQGLANDAGLKMSSEALKVKLNSEDGRKDVRSMAVHNTQTIDAKIEAITNNGKGPNGSLSPAQLGQITKLNQQKEANVKIIERVDSMDARSKTIDACQSALNKDKMRGAGAYHGSQKARTVTENQQELNKIFQSAKK